MREMVANFSRPLRLLQSMLMPVQIVTHAIAPHAVTQFKHSSMGRIPAPLNETDGGEQTPTASASRRTTPRILVIPGLVLVQRFQRIGLVPARPAGGRAPKNLGHHVPPITRAAFPRVLADTGIVEADVPNRRAEPK